MGNTNNTATTHKQTLQLIDQLGPEGRVGEQKYWGSKVYCACGSLFSHVSCVQEQQLQQQAKRVPDGHGRSFGSWPLQKHKVNLMERKYLIVNAAKLTVLGSSQQCSARYPKIFFFAQWFFVLARFFVGIFCKETGVLR